MSVTPPPTGAGPKKPIGQLPGASGTSEKIDQTKKETPAADRDQLGGLPTPAPVSQRRSDNGLVRPQPASSPTSSRVLPPVERDLRDLDLDSGLPSAELARAEKLANAYGAASSERQTLLQGAMGALQRLKVEG